MDALPAPSPGREGLHAARLEGTARRALPEARGIGLRGQIMIALVTGLGLAVALVGIAVDRLASHALEAERAHSAHLVAQAAAGLLRRVDAPAASLDRVEDAMMAPDRVTGLELVAHGRTVDARGVVGRGLLGRAPLDGGEVRVWLASTRGLSEHGDGASASLVRLVILYAATTCAGILLLCYFLLTRLIVRPVEELTRAATRLSRGPSGARATVHGAAEVQSLALAFNAMSDELRAEHVAREGRLRELEVATRELRSTQDSLVRSEKLASVGRLAAGVAHEIGNPLAAILGLVELVRQGDLEPAEHAEFLRRIQNETERIQRIIRDLLDFSRQGASVTVGRCDLGEVVAGAVHLVAPQGPMRGIVLQQRVPSHLPEVAAPADALTQVVLNLLLNAADAIEGEGSITLELSEEDDAVTLTVTDTGPGIAPEVRDRLFEPFVTTKPVGQGTGLGLAVCWTIVDRLGGTVRADDAPGGGARFSVRLPLAS